jgi:BCCIP
MSGKAKNSASSGAVTSSVGNSSAVAGQKRPRDELKGGKKSAESSRGGSAAPAKTNAKEKPSKKQRKAKDESSESEEEDLGYSSSGTESDDIDDLDLAAEYHSFGEDDDEDGDSDDDSVINVEFEFFDPRPDDFKSVRRLIERYLPGEETTFDASGMADAIIEQQALGTMVKVVDDPDVYAFATILPIEKYKVSFANPSFCRTVIFKRTLVTSSCFAFLVTILPCRRPLG